MSRESTQLDKRPLKWAVAQLVYNIRMLKIDARVDSKSRTLSGSKPAKTWYSIHKLIASPP